MRHRWFLLAALTLSCEANDEQDSLPLDKFPQAYVDANCATAVRCGLYADLSTCQRNSLGLSFSVQPSVDAGRLHYDGNAAATCLARVRESGCSQREWHFSISHTDCDLRHIFIGTVAVGGACLNSSECADEGSCNLDACDNANACCLGVCEAAMEPPRLTKGASCTAFDQCEAGLVCQPSAPNAPLTCEPASGDENTPCQTTSDCDAPLVCGENANNERVCIRLPSLGQACTLQMDDNCEGIGQYCDSNLTCADRPGPGEACTTPCDDTTTPCGYEEPCVGSQCENNVCKAYAGLNEPCDDNLQNCTMYLECIAGTCKDQPETICP